MVAPMVLDGPINGAVFQAYVDLVLVPTLKPGDIIIMDSGATSPFGCQAITGSCPPVEPILQAPGAGTVVALTYMSAVTDPARLKRSSSAYFGMTPSRYQLGGVDRPGASSSAETS
jgi:hypothetical protein